MTEARPTLEYRAAADDRRQSVGRVLRYLSKTVLVTGVILFAYLFLLCVLGAILLGVASLVTQKLELGLAAGTSVGLALLCFVLMMGCARGMKLTIQKQKT